jgi:hypothetical protein
MFTNTSSSYHNADADIMCFDHTHNDAPQGCYGLLHINDHSRTTDKNSIHVEFIRFAYDVEKAAQAVEDSPLPQAFTDALRKMTPIFTTVAPINLRENILTHTHYQIRKLLATLHRRKIKLLQPADGSQPGY